MSFILQVKRQARVYGRRVSTGDCRGQNHAPSDGVPRRVAANTLGLTQGTITATRGIHHAYNASHTAKPLLPLLSKDCWLPFRPIEHYSLYSSTAVPQNEKKRETFLLSSCRQSKNSNMLPLPFPNKLQHHKTDKKRQHECTHRPFSLYLNLTTLASFSLYCTHLVRREHLLVEIPQLLSALHHLLQLVPRQLR